MSSDQPPKELDHLIGILRQNYEFFGEMDDLEISDILRQCERKSFEPNKIIYQKGEKANEFYIIMAGKVTGNIKGFKAILESGHIFGDAFLYNVTIRIMTMTAADKTVLLVLTNEIFERLLPSLRSKMLYGLAKEMAFRTEVLLAKIEELTAERNNLQVILDKKET